jgi:hypothetical protein
MLRAYDKPRLQGVRIGYKIFAVDVTYTFEPIQSGTRLQYECQLTYSNWVARWMGYLFGWLTRKISVKQMTMLKDWQNEHHEFD